MSVSSHIVLMKIVWLLIYILEKPEDIETTARGAAFAAGLAVGLYDQNSDTFLSQTMKTFTPLMSDEVRESKLKIWRDAVQRSFDFVHDEEE